MDENNIQVTNEQPVYQFIYSIAQNSAIIAWNSIFPSPGTAGAAPAIPGMTKVIVPTLTWQASLFFHHLDPQILFFVPTLP